MPDDGLVLTGATLIDGTGAAPMPDAALQIQGERIAWVGPASDLPAAAHGLPTRDVSGKWLIPGLIDAHVHISWNGRESVMDLVKRDRDLLLLEAVQTVRRILQSGTTTIRDIGGQHHIEMSIRKGIQAGWFVGPRMRVSGRIITMTGGHGHYISIEADGPDEIRKAAREQIKAGADTIKLMATGGAATPGQDVMASQLTVDELRAAVGAAHAMGRTVATHCHGTEGIRNSVVAGVDTIEHGTYLDDDTAALMADHGAALVLTLGVAQPDLDKVPPGEQAEFDRLAPILAKLSEQCQHAIAAARQHNVLIGIGTDAGGNPLAPHDFSLSRELEHLVNSGFTTLEALTIATRNNAQILRWDDDLGTLEAGKLADLVVLSADPLADIGNVRAIDTVYQGGTAVSFS